MKKQEKFISKEEKKKTGKLKRAIAVGATTLAAVGLCLNQTGALAYLTDYAHVTNKFTEGKVSITPSEPNWTHDPEDPGDKEQVTPGDIFNKDPQITADEDSISPAFVYMQVKIPYGKVTKVNDDGTLFDKDTNGKRTTAHHMLITYGEGEPTKDAQDEFLVGDASLVKFDPASEGLDTSLAPNGHSLTNNINDTKDGWTLLQVEKTGLAAGDDDANGVIKGYLVFTYAYNSMLANTDSLNTKYADLVGETIQKKTTPFFEKIRMINVVEGQLDLVSYQMPIKVFAIQAAHTGTGGDEDSNTLGNNGNGVPTSTADVITQAKAAYVTYSNQNVDNGTATTLVSNFETN